MLINGWLGKFNIIIINYSKLKRSARKLIRAQTVLIRASHFSLKFWTCLIPALQERRRTSRLIFLYKVIEGMVPAINPEEYITFTRNKRIIRRRNDPNFNTTNIIDKYTTNNDRGIQVKQIKTEQYKNSFFPKSAIDWNHLDSETVHASTVEGFRTALQHCY